MMKAIEWAFSSKAPMWVGPVAFLALVSLLVAFAIFTVYLLSIDQYLIVMILWIVAPLFLVWREYKKSGRKE